MRPSLNLFGERWTPTQCSGCFAPSHEVVTRSLCFPFICLEVAASTILLAQGASVTAMQLCHELNFHLRDNVMAQLVCLLSLLPRLEVVGGLQLAPSSAASAAQVHSSVRALLRACSPLASLHLSSPGVGEQPLQLPAALFLATWRCLNVFKRCHLG